MFIIAIYNFLQVFGIGIGATAILTLLTPLAAKSSVYVLLAVRIIEGIFEVNCFYFYLFCCFFIYKIFKIYFYL